VSIVRQLEPELHIDGHAQTVRRPPPAPAWSGACLIALRSAQLPALAPIAASLRSAARQGGQARVDVSGACCVMLTSPCDAPHLLNI